MLSRKFSTGGGIGVTQEPIINYIYGSAEELQARPEIKRVLTRNPDTGNTICLGACLNVHKELGYPIRDLLYSTKGYERVIGDNDNTIDSWNMLSAAYNNDKFEVLYDRDRDGDLTPEQLANLPVNALIGTGDARGHFGISKNNPKRLSRHTITTLGFDKEGNALVYDMGRIHKGIPSRYDGEVNFIVVPRDKKVFFKDINPNRTQEQILPTTNPSTPVTAPPTVPIEQEDYEVPVLEQSNIARMYAEMLNRSRYQRQLLKQRKQQQEMY